jgi:threonine aldolase
MLQAELGDDVLGEDPTVNRLEEEAAGLFGKEAALLVPSGTMANLVALMCHGGHGDEIFLDPGAHVYNYEAGSLCSIAGYTPRFLRAARGRPDPASLRESIRSANTHFPRPRLLWLENTHNLGGGTILPPALQQELVAAAREHGLKVHLDGARIFNAAVALKAPLSDLARDVDSLSFCLSKGLSCPIGSLAAGPAGFIAEARRARKRLGGGMRQAGIIAACGLVALRTMIPRLEEDHRNARALAESLVHVPGLEVNPAEVETNMVFAGIAGWGVSSSTAARVLKEEGVRASEMAGQRLRLVTHRMIKAADIAPAAEAFQRAARRFIKT